MEHIGNISRQRLLKITMFLSGLFYSYEQYYALELILPLIWIANQFIFTSTCPYIVSRKYHLAQFYALKIWSGWKMLWKCFYLNCLGFEATGKPGRYLAFLGKLQIFQMVSIFIEHFKERNSKLNFPNLHVAEKLLSYQPCMHALGNNIRQAECQGDQGGEDVWYGWLTATTFQTTCPTTRKPTTLTCRSMLEHCHQPILTRQVPLIFGCFSVNNGAWSFI